MPDPAPEKRRPAAPRGSLPAPPALATYAELHCRTNYSFLEAASFPDELVAESTALGYHALAITDRHSLAGVVRAHLAAKETGLKLVIGAQITPRDALPVLLWATNRAAYGRLARLLTIGRRRVGKGHCDLSFADLAEAAEGLLAGVIPTDQVLAACEPSSLAQYRSVFGDRTYSVAELHLGPDDRLRLAQLERWSRSAHVPLVAANDVHYHTPDRQRLQDVLTAIRLGTTVAEAAGRLFPNAERYLKSPPEMQALFAQRPDAVARTREVADRCTFSMDELRYEYPEELAPPGMTPLEHLTRLTWSGARERYPDGLPDKIRGLIEHELALIADLHYEAYFLTVWDLVRFARSRDILCQGRGSAANSAVCFCLGVTSVDPARIDVLFERFVSRERAEAPDIDVDFEHERREEVLQYLYEKYGRDRAGLTAEVITYRPRSAIRDVGKALGLSLARVDAVSKLLHHHHSPPEELAARFVEAGLDPHSPLSHALLACVSEIIGFPRHLSQHVGGMVVTRGPLCELVPIENAAMADRTVVQWDKDDLDGLGILKVDVLALGMLTAIHRAFDFIRRHHKRDLTLATVPAEDPAVYDMICRADTMGVFQIESRAQMSMLPRLKPRAFYDLVIEVAIVRPGPIQGNMVHPYLRRRAGEEAVSFPNDSVRAVLEKTLGVPIFQEQAMRLAVVAAGFTPGEADQLRRAMAAWRRPGLIEPFRQKLMEGMLARGLPAEFAEQVFKQIKGFGEYGFPESHAASFALLVYVSAWIKHYYMAAFTAALINSQPMGFYAPGQLIRNAREHGVEIRPVDVNASDWDCTLELATTADSTPREATPGVSPSSYALRLGFRLLRGVSEAAARQLVAARGDVPYRSWRDFVHRSGLPRGVLARLARADSVQGLGLGRRGALWQTLAEERERPLFAALADDDPLPDLPALSPAEEITADYQTAGFSLRGHPIGLLREDLDRLRITRCGKLIDTPHGRTVRVAGLVLLRQRPSTAKGITFVTLEDESGVANLIVRMEIWERYHRVARTSNAWIAHGGVERQGQVVHVVVRRLEDLSTRLAGLPSRSRDFH